MEMDYPQQFEEAVATTIHKQLNSFHNWRRMFKERKIRIPSAESLILIQVPSSQHKLSLSTLQLNLTVNDKSLQDQFEWDVKNENVSPESFAHSLCSDLGLSKEFEVSIAHSIREQVFVCRYASCLLFTLSLLSSLSLSLSSSSSSSLLFSPLLYR